MPMQFRYHLVPAAAALVVDGLVRSAWAGPPPWPWSVVQREGSF